MNLNEMREIPWQRHLNTVIKVCLDTKILGLLVMMGFTIYGIGWDTVLNPSLEQLKSRDKAIQEQRNIINGQKNLENQYSSLEKQLSNFNIRMIPIPAGDSAKVVSVSEAAELLKLAKGQLRNEQLLPILQPPHNQRLKVSLSPTGNTSLDILNISGAPQSATSPPPGNPDAPGPRPGEVAHESGEQPASSLPAEQYTFELKAQGTYPALSDLVNELVLQEKLVKINKITITKPAAQEPEPDPEQYPDYPVPLEMTVSISIFLYAGDPSNP